ncbi:TfpX/TfpZ family type IV pilin accessory protein [Acidovorax sp.]|uniref:TfpX/TfpZ family type IV pilin accessory protein n=1 Tax=Acidovorax sp. TaxID=1872122 RepID=UPI00391F83EB
MHRLQFAGLHLLCSMAVAGIVSMVVLWGLYPHPFRELSGGIHLFAILVAVDVGLGPLATAVVSRPGKGIREWRMDIALIAMIQLGALAYGIWTIYQARPVYLSFEIDRFRVVHAIDVEPELLAKAAPAWSDLPKWGPGLIAVRPFASAEESSTATMAALQGAELSFRPEFWMPYADAAAAIKLEYKPLADVVQRHPTRADEVSAVLKTHGLTLESARYLPLHSRKAFWTAVIHPETMQPVAYLDIDPYPN